MSNRRHPHVANLDEIETHTDSHGSRFGSTSKWLAEATGGKQLGCSWYEIPPGRSAYPFHFHCHNEEALYVLEGRGRLRIGQETVEVRAGDYMAFPAGPDNAHMLFNHSDQPLRYLVLSTMHEVEICGFPDAKKWSASAGPMEARWVRKRFWDDSEIDYFAGEPDA